MKPLPRYVWALHAAAKFAAHPPANASVDDLVRYQAELNAAVIEFERNMPVFDGAAMVDEEDHG